MAHLESPRDEGDLLHRRSEAHGAPTGHVHISVNSARVRFEVWDEDTLWWGAAQQTGYGLVVEAHDMATDRFALVRVQDIEPYLAGRRAHLRTLRGED